ncbi:hypothetical protein BC831DRAFT_496382 [Entophlyctis helioformis]|nr:hypothetical protein BC831DRAFT_496382 [Entophlyctis helioformis]
MDQSRLDSSFSQAQTVMTIFFVIFGLIVVASIVGSCLQYQRREEERKASLAYIESSQQANLAYAASLNQQSMLERQQHDQLPMYAAPAYPPPAAVNGLVPPLSTPVVPLVTPAAAPAATPAASAADMMRILIATERQRDPIGTFGRTDDEVASVLLARR